MKNSVILTLKPCIRAQISLIHAHFALLDDNWPILPVLRPILVTLRTFSHEYEGLCTVLGRTSRDSVQTPI